MSEPVLPLVLVIGDMVAAAAAVVSAPVLWEAFDEFFRPHPDYWFWQVTLGIAWVASLWGSGGADVGGPQFARRSLGATGRAVAYVGALVLVLFYFSPFFVPRGATLVLLPMAASWTLAWRSIYLRVLSSYHLQHRAAVVGSDEAARRVVTAMEQASGALRYEVVAFISDDDDAAHVPAGTTPLIPGNVDVWSRLRELDIDTLVVGHTRNVPEPVLAELTRCFEHGVAAVPATALYEQLTGKIMVGSLEADWYAALPTYSRGLYMPVKRFLDVVIACLVAALAVVPALLIALSIMAESGRPIFHSQLRVGQRGRMFTLHKFRSMRSDAEQGGHPRWAQPEDERVTGVGRLIRRLRLDELPQLWNVIRGEMSLIGPRPERPEFVETLAAKIPIYRARSLVRPGITGWAQVRYPYARTVDQNIAKLEYDLYYVRHLSPVLDVAVLLRTAAAMVRPPRVT